VTDFARGQDALKQASSRMVLVRALQAALAGDAPSAVATVPVLVKSMTVPLGARTLVVRDAYTGDLC
jgi:hypothetical protein